MVCMSVMDPLLGNRTSKVLDLVQWPIWEQDQASRNVSMRQMRGSGERAQAVPLS